MTTDFKKLSEQYKHELLDKVVPFWLEKSQDLEHGGYFTCLDREGNVFDTDKFIWLQGREVWMFATLYNKVEKRQEWLDCAIQGAEFLKKYGHDGNLNWYFSLDREGHPLVASSASPQATRNMPTSPSARLTSSSQRLTIRKAVGTRLSLAPAP